MHRIYLTTLLSNAPAGHCPWQFLLSPGRLSLQQRLTMSLCGEHPLQKLSMSQQVSHPKMCMYVLIFRGVVKDSCEPLSLCRYKTLKKPSWNLPTPIFGPAW